MLSQFATRVDEDDALGESLLDNPHERGSAALAFGGPTLRLSTYDELANYSLKRTSTYDMMAGEARGLGKTSWEEKEHRRIKAMRARNVAQARGSQNWAPHMH